MSTAIRTRGQSAARQQWTDGLLLVLGLAIAWKCASWGLGVEVLPGPWRTLQQLMHELLEPDFPAHLAETSKAFFTALLIAVVAGVGLGLFLGARRLAGDVMEPILIALYSIPKISLYPVILLMFGLGLSAKIAFGVIHGIIPITIFTMTAVRNIPQVYLRTIKAHRLTPWQGARHVLVPATIPEIVAGLRIGFSLTLLGTLLGEMFASQRGIGHMLMLAIDRNNPPTIMALSLMLFLFATVVSIGLLRWDRHLRRGIQPRGTE
ncbi:ABC transporter permease [Pollutimonas harenae]|uniref:ABC transporter permease subunit n=1 Tax=Pollutimonas harenae TaxID=657015 RepID=A0A853GM47_9BURK|nr:ABC transporter permease subunit [Pollutimonas harenae]NYT84068.1 ABC transporter permease subunit [Pollutimonas harenae]TEA73507.1 ABC transporter permease subunit [Pollutimonas harenae]